MEDIAFLESIDAYAQAIGLVITVNILQTVFHAPIHTRIAPTMDGATCSMESAYANLDIMVRSVKFQVRTDLFAANFLAKMEEVAQSLQRDAFVQKVLLEIIAKFQQTVTIVLTATVTAATTELAI